MKIAVVGNDKRGRQKIYQKSRSCFELGEDEIDTYTTGKELLALMYEYDILFIEVEMLGMNGFEISKRYRKLYPNSIHIMVSSHMEFAREGYREGYI